MSAGYWKMVGENIAKGMGEKAARRLGTSAKFLGRAGAVVGIGFLAYELFKSYKDNIEKEPAFREMMILQAEITKWTSAISCLGREADSPHEFGKMDEGGAINALFPKKSLSGKGIKPPDSKLAANLVNRAARYLKEAENLMDTEGRDDFEAKKAALIEELEELGIKINRVKDYRPIQEKLSRIVAEIKPIETGYSSRIYDCSREIQKTLGSNAAWAALSMATLGIIKKPAANR